MRPPRVLVRSTFALLAATLSLSCENRVNRTRQCLGNGSITKRFDQYTFEIESGPALDVAGNCHIILDHCDVHAPIGIRATENAVVEVRGGSIIASDKLVELSGNARVTFEQVQTQGQVSINGAATVVGLRP